MEVPFNLKESLHNVLQSCTGGIFIEDVCDEYFLLTKRFLPFRQLGFSCIEDFLRSVPDVARLEYSVRERRMTVHGVGDFKFTGLQNQNGQGFMPLPSTSTRKVEVHSVKQGILVKQEATSTQASDTPLNIKPDHRGVYTLCFPAGRKPEDLVGTLEEMFSVAGKVFETYETVRWIYVCYSDLQSVQRAFKMFQHLGMKVASEAALKMDRTGKGTEKRKWEGTEQRAAPNIAPRKRRRGHAGPSQRIYVGNLNPNVKYSFDMFRKLLHEFKVSWVTLKGFETPAGEKKTFAYILTANRQQAEGIVKKFDGHVWYGNRLTVSVKEKKKDVEKNGMNLDASRDTSIDAEEIDMPGLEPALPGLEPAMPDLELAMPDLELAMPGLERARPGLERARRGMKSAMPGLEPAMPGLEPVMPGLEPILPPLEPALPPLEPILPPLEPVLPPLEPALPELEHVAPLENFRVQRSFEVPTVLVTNIKDDVDEVALKCLFAVYKPKVVRISCSQFGRKKAFIELGSVEDVKQAVKNLNQSFYNGQRLKVDVPFNKPELRKAVLGFSQLRANSSGSVTLSDVLKTRGNLLSVLNLPDFPFHLGQQVQVLITAVISDKFFWGQVQDRRLADELQKISDSINEPSQTDMASGPGRCKARFQGDGKWYRAWVMRTSNQQVTQQCRVFYLDYGNTAQIPWAHTAKTAERWHWDLAPLAIPFTLIDGVPNLKDRELTHITVEVNALGNQEEGNMVVARAVSLVPNLKETMSSITRTIIV
ncbi:uncharacterized protein LOC143296892 [Babylonia areolata]|uniref:uncharacterized protein LOC143296892 n=1 Tax=Babylonia areolata TaxID=304850 RepID=UPI003FCF5E77